MKGIFKRMKGRAVNKKGGSLITVMVTMAVLSIVGLCAASIALTNYRTTKTYTSQDEYYYAGETGQKQFVAHINDVAYNYASNKEVWTDTDIEGLFNEVANIEFDLSDTTYNGEYTVTNKIVSLGTNSNGKYDLDDNGSAIFTIVTTVTDKDGSSQEYTSEVKVRNPKDTSDFDAGKPEVSEIVTVPGDDGEEGVFNTGYGVVAKSTQSNTSWYGLWGNFNTYTTVQNGTTPYKNKSLNQSKGVAKILLADTENKNTSAVYLARGDSSSKASATTPTKDTLFFNSSNSKIGTEEAKKKFNTFFGDGGTVDGLNIDILKVIDLYSSGTGVLGASGVDSSGNPYINLNVTDKLNGNSLSQNYYVKTDADMVNINFPYKPTDYVKEKGGVRLNTLKSWTESQSAYRVVFTKTGSFDIFSSTISHEIAYKYRNGSTYNVTNSVLTYPDHYYTNKWFFIDLGGDGTLYLNNTTSTSKNKEVDYSVEWHRWFGWLPILHGTKTVTEYTCQDAYENYNYPSLGNIVMEDCYFFVNGNISIANAYNLSNCKVFATGDILLEKVYYLEGLLSLETDSGSPTIEQSLYYCKGQFVSELVSRYAMNWFVENSGTVAWTTEKYDSNGNYAGYNEHSKSKSKFNESAAYTTYMECAISNACSYTEKVQIGFLKTEADGYLATFRYPTVLKATIIAMGSGEFAPSSTLTYYEESRGKYTKKTKQYAELYGQKFSNIVESVSPREDVSVILNPDGGTFGVIDCVLIEGQIFANGKVYSTNYNYDTYNGTNRYSASSQIQYKPYTAGGTISGTDGKDPTLGQVFENIIQETVDASTSVTYSPITVVNGGIYKK